MTHDEYQLIRCKDGGWLLIGGDALSGKMRDHWAFTDFTDLKDAIPRILEPKK